MLGEAMADKQAPRVLMVDDEPAIRETLPPILEQHGFAVATASSVPDALDAINKQRFDILLADLNIGQPGDGFTVVSAMRRTQPEAVTIIITGFQRSKLLWKQSAIRWTTTWLSRPIFLRCYRSSIGT